MKKILAILMALAMIFSLAACGNKEKEEDKKTTEAVSDDEAILEAAEAYYDALVSGNGEKIKKSMASVFEDFLAMENPFEGVSDEEAAFFEQLYGIDISDPNAIFEVLALTTLEEFGEVDSIAVDKVDFEKYSKKELQEKNQEFVDEGIDDYKVDDAADGKAFISVVLEDGQEIVTSQNLIFVKEGDEWKVIPDDDGEEDEEDIDYDEDDIVIEPVNSEEAAINTAATAYYTAIVTANGAALKSSMTEIFDQFIQIENPLDGMTDEEIASVELLYGVSLSDPDAFYTFYALMTKEDLGDPVNIEVAAIDYEKFAEDEVAAFNGEIAADGITIAITNFAEAEVKIVITYDDGTTAEETQYVSFVEENGAWKVFPEM